MFKKILNRPPEKAVPATPQVPAAPSAIVAPVHSPESVLHAVTEQLRQVRGELSVFGPRLSRALAGKDWTLASKTLLDLVDTAAELSARLAPVRQETMELVPAPAAAEDNGGDGWNEAAVGLLEVGIPALLLEDDGIAAHARQLARRARQDAADGKLGML